MNLKYPWGFSNKPPFQHCNIPSQQTVRLWRVERFNLQRMFHEVPTDILPKNDHSKTDSHRSHPPPQLRFEFLLLDDFWGLASVMAMVENSTDDPTTRRPRIPWILNTTQIFKYLWGKSSRYNRDILSMTWIILVDGFSTIPTNVDANVNACHLKHSEIEWNQQSTLTNLLFGMV